MVLHCQNLLYERRPSLLEWEKECTWGFKFSWVKHIQQNSKLSLLNQDLNVLVKFLLKRETNSGKKITLSMPVMSKADKLVMAGCVFLQSLTCLLGTEYHTSAACDFLWIWNCQVTRRCCKGAMKCSYAWLPIFLWKNWVFYCVLQIQPMSQEIYGAFSKLSLLSGLCFCLVLSLIGRKSSYIG